MKSKLKATEQKKITEAPIYKHNTQKITFLVTLTPAHIPTCPASLRLFLSQGSKCVTCNR